MKVVVIGCTGFIGNHILVYLEKTKEYDLQGISTGQIDLTKTNSHLALSKYLTADCIVIMCAAVKKQLGDNLDTFEKNLAIINNFCRAVSISPPRKIIFFSSASVYGEDVFYPEKITEKTPVQPRTYYGMSKYTAERLIEITCADNDTRLVTLRPPLIYGIDDKSRGYGPTGFIYKVFNNERIVLWGDGSEFREFIYIDDIGRVTLKLLENGFSGILNLVGGNSYTFMEIIQLLGNLFGFDIEVISSQRSKEKVDHHYSNNLIGKLMRESQFTRLEDGLRKMYESMNN